MTEVTSPELQKVGKGKAEKTSLKMTGEIITETNNVNFSM